MVSSSPMVKSHLFAEHTGLLFPSRLLCKAPDWHEQPAAHCPAGILNSQAQTRTSGLPTPRPLPLPRPLLSRDFPTALAPFAQALAWPRTLSVPHRPSAAMVPTITPRPESASRSVLPAHSSKQHTSHSRFCLSLESWLSTQAQSRFFFLNHKHRPGGSPRVRARTRRISFQALGLALLHPRPSPTCFSGLSASSIGPLSARYTACPHGLKR